MVAPRMSKEEVLARIDDPDTVLIDVRKDKKEAKRKIKNAVLEEPEGVHCWSNKYGDERALILYCDCEKERTSAATVQKILDKGRKKVYALEGGLKSWLQADYPTEAI